MTDTTTTTTTTASRPTAAAQRAIERNSTAVSLVPGLAAVRIPAPRRLAWYGGIAALAVAGLIEWPVAAVLAVGHLLAEDHHNKMIRDFGEALEEL
jgi:hypothetical protein